MAVGSVCEHELRTVCAHSGSTGLRRDAGAHKISQRGLSVVQAKQGTFTPPNSKRDGLCMGISRPRVVMLLTRDQFMHGAVLCRVLALTIFCL